MTNNIEALSGSPVQVTIDSISAGSVKVASTVVFLNGDASSASTYQTALTNGDTSSVFGTSFGGISVDTSSIKTVTVSNPSKLALTYGRPVAAIKCKAALPLAYVLPVKHALSCLQLACMAVRCC